LQDKLLLIPTQEQVNSIYQASTERLRYADYRRDIGKPKWIWALITMFAIHTKSLNHSSAKLLPWQLW
jgi:hypothetical protein